jgi:hypothetical protein
MRSHLRILVLLATLPPAAAIAEPVLLLPATGSNLHEGHLAAATDVLRSHLERTGRFTIVRGALPAAGREPNAAEAGAAARAAGVPIAVTLHLARLGASASVRLAAYGPDGAVRHTDELGAATPEDLDPVLRRLAEGLATDRPARTLAQIDTITVREADPFVKYAATNVFGIRLGGASFLDRGSGVDAARLAGGGVFWLYDARSYLAEIAFDVLDGDGDDHLVAFTLGVYRPLSKSNLSPYVGGALSYAWASGLGADDAGLALRATGGLLFGRLSNVQIRAELSVFATLFERQVAVGEAVRDYGPMVSVGIGF